MKKSVLWVMAAILTCGFAITSCTNEIDNPVVPDPQPVVPDQASMFVKNVLDDERYTHDVLAVEGDSLNFLRLNVSGYEEATAEFLKLLPEGVAETAELVEDEEFLFTDITVVRLSAPLTNDVDTLAFGKVMPGLTSAIGYAWVILSPDLADELGADAIVYMPETSEDDLDNLMFALMGIMPYSTLDPEDPSHLICTAANIEQYRDLIASFLTRKMIDTFESTPEGDMRMTLTDPDGNIYGYMISLDDKNHPADVFSVLVFDEDVQKSLIEKLGGAFSKVSFYVAEGGENVFNLNQDIATETNFSRIFIPGYRENCRTFARFRPWKEWVVKKSE